jgi:hypothetical protein
MGATTTPTRKPRAPRKAPTPKPRPVAVPVDGFEPIRIVTPETPPEIELVEIFSIDGKPFCIPMDVSPSVSLRFMKLARLEGMEIAMAGLLEEMLGTEAYDALANYPHLTKEQFADVMVLIRRHTMGAVEAPKEHSKTA